MKTTNERLDALFDFFVDEMMEQVEEGRKVVTKEGEVVMVSPDAATLSVIRQFLRDNGINVIGESGKSTKGQKLAEVLPFAVDRLMESQ